MSNDLRKAIVDEARTWIGTPFHHAARIKGEKGGVDCVNFLAGVFSAVGAIPALELEDYPPDWHLHSDVERFLNGLAEHAVALAPGEPILPGDIVMFKFGRHAAHGSIVVEWPVVIHAFMNAGRVTLTEADSGPLGGRFYGVWRLKGLL